MGCTRSGRWVYAALGLPALLAAVVGCGSSEATVNRVALERAIAGTIMTQRHVYSLVSCPQSIPRQKGHTFTCDAKLTVGSYPMYVTETDDSGHVRYSNGASLVVLDTAKVAGAIEAAVLSQRKLHAQVTCPARVLQKKGVYFTCIATAGGVSHPFRVLETDGSGHVRFNER